MKHYENGKMLSEKILSGVNKLADNVGSTLGPCGKNVILQEENKRPIVTKDGVTVANFVSFKDPFENVGADIVKQASNKTNSVAGDGTTTATILTRSIMNMAQRYLSAGINPRQIAAQFGT